MILERALGVKKESQKTSFSLVAFPNNHEGWPTQAPTRENHFLSTFLSRFPLDARSEW